MQRHTHTQYTDRQKHIVAVLGGGSCAQGQKKHLRSALPHWCSLSTIETPREVSRFFIIAVSRSFLPLSIATFLLLMGTSWPSLVSVLILLCCASTCLCWSIAGPISASGISAILAHVLVPNKCSNRVLSHPRHMHDALWRCAVRHLRGGSVGGDRSGMSSCCKGQAATTMSEKGPQQFKRNAVVGVLGYLQLLPRGAGQVVSAYAHEHVCVFARVRVCAFVCSLSLPFSLCLSLCLLLSLTLSFPPLGHTYKHMQILIRLHLHRY